MARRRFSSSRIGQSQRRRSEWTGGPEGILSPASTAVSVFATSIGADTAGFTLVRTRGELLLQLLSTSAAQTGFQWAFGMGIVTSKAFTIGATAIPGPLTEIGWEGWFFHSQGALKIGGALSANTVDAGPASFHRLPIDSKAMRKLNTDEVVVAVLETVEVGTSTMHAELRSRLLFKLP